MSAREVHARHILVKTEAEAQTLLFDLKRGTSFEETAMKHSSCPSAKRGGDLGWFGKGQMVKEFENAAFALKPGELSPPIKSQFGWHIIKVEETR